MHRPPRGADSRGTTVVRITPARRASSPRSDCIRERELVSASVGATQWQTVQCNADGLTLRHPHQGRDIKMLPPLRVALSPAPGLCTLVLFIVAVVTLAGAAPRQPQEAGPALRPGPGLGPRATVPSEAFELRNSDPLSGDYGKVRGPPTKATAWLPQPKQTCVPVGGHVHGAHRVPACTASPVRVKRIKSVAMGAPAVGAPHACDAL